MSLSYVDVLFVFGVGTACMLPLLFLLKPNQPGGKAPEGHRSLLFLEAGPRGPLLGKGRSAARSRAGAGTARQTRRTKTRRGAWPGMTLAVDAALPGAVAVPAPVPM